jgi:competence protein ComEA
MTPFEKSILEWLGYSRRERRSTIIMLVILIFCICYPYLITSRKTEFKDLSMLLSFSDSLEQYQLRASPDTTVLFKFDPNSASLDTLIDMGLSEKQARTIINYRIKGGKFYRPEDFRKIYGIDSATSSKIIPYIYIHNDTKRIRSFSSDSVSKSILPVLIDLNTADSAALEKLPGLGPVLSSRIIKYRKILGGYCSVEQLREVYGLKEATFNNLIGRVFADSSAIVRINVNVAAFKDFTRHPYLNKYDIQAVLKYREIKGIIKNTDELIDNKILTSEKATKIAPYLKF